MFNADPHWASFKAILCRMAFFTVRKTMQLLSDIFHIAIQSVHGRQFEKTIYMFIIRFIKPFTPV